MASESGVYECETCEFREFCDGLAPENEMAWRAYAQMTSHRWVWDMQAGPWWVQRVIDRVDEDDREELMARIDVIYDALHPPQEKRRGA